MDDANKKAIMNFPTEEVRAEIDARAAGGKQKKAASPLAQFDIEDLIAAHIAAQSGSSSRSGSSSARSSVQPIAARCTRSNRARSEEHTSELQSR